MGLQTDIGAIVILATILQTCIVVISIYLIVFILQDARKNKVFEFDKQKSIILWHVIKVS